MSKASWGEGEWQHEPDLLRWTANLSGYPCVAARHPVLGYWLGYVGVHPDHPMHGAPLEDVRVGSLYVHNEHLDLAALSTRTQLAPLDQPPGYWWFGFNCGHPSQNDLSPGFLPEMRTAGLPAELLDSHSRWLATRVYRNRAYVTEQCETLARQLAYLADPGLGAYIVASRAKQGLPPTVTDPATLQRVANIFFDDRP